jgi:uncharacterized metal-binding protein
MAGCNCGQEKTIIITACSGAANTGLLADQVARKLRAEKVGSMICLAALGAELSGYVESARASDRNIVIDGCPVACGAKIFQKLGLKYEGYVMTDYGAEKGKTEITQALIDDVGTRVAADIGSKRD